MTKNPFYNALLAEAYILLIVTTMSFGTRNLPKEDTFFAPIAAITLFTLSAAVMGYLFIFKPLTLYLDGQKREGTKLFLQTVSIFAVITIIVFIILFSGVL